MLRYVVDLVLSKTTRYAANYESIQNNFLGTKLLQKLRSKFLTKDFTHHIVINKLFFFFRFPFSLSIFFAFFLSFFCLSVEC